MIPAKDSKTSVVAALARKNFLPLLASTALLATSTTFAPFATAATTSTSVDCSAQLAACSADDTCLECITRSVTSSAQATCEESYQDGEHTQCEYTAISYCCQSETSATATCLNDDITLAYWSCILEEDGCSLDDMPCIGAETEAPTASPTTSPVTSPTSATDDDEDNDDDASWATRALPSSALYTGGIGLALAAIGTLM